MSKVGKSGSRNASPSSSTQTDKRHGSGSTANSARSQASKSSKSKLKSFKNSSPSKALVSSVASFTLKLGLPDPKRYEDAPEIAHLKMQVTSNGKNYVETGKCCFGDCFGLFTKCCGPQPTELDDLEPVLARTRHSIEYVQYLADPKSVSGKSSAASRIVSPLANDPSLPSKQKAYKALYEGLNHIHHIHHIYKQLILLVTFSRYANKPLAEYELQLTHQRTILGSNMWMTAYILEQVQYDSETIYAGYPTHEVEEVLKLVEKVVGQSVLSWRAAVRTIETVEQIHEQVEHIFSTIVAKFPHDEILDFKNARHIRVHSNFHRRAEELEKLKDFNFAHPNNPQKAHATYATFSLAPLRIIYKNVESHKLRHAPSKLLSPNIQQEQDEEPELEGDWRGFDMLVPDKKFAIIKNLLRDVSKMFQLIIDQLENIGRNLRSGKNCAVTTNSLASPVLSFQDGLYILEKHFEDIDKKTWTQKDVKEFLEVEKITVDNMDLLTVGTATLRTLLHDARHIIHVCYELIRSLDYAECRQMSAYFDLVSQVLQQAEEYRSSHKNPKEDSDEDMETRSRRSKQSSYRQRSFDSGNNDGASINFGRFGRRLLKGRNKRRSLYDVKEQNIDQHDVEQQFDRSIYQDIIKELPVQTNNFGLELTLMDAEMVFSESSHAMLSTQVHV